MTVAVIANDNVELACAFIQKKAIEKAIQEIDKRLKNEYEQRIGKKHALKKYEQFALNTSCVRGSTGSNITSVVQF